MSEVFSRFSWLALLFFLSGVLIDRASLLDSREFQHPQVTESDRCVANIAAAVD